VWSLSIPGAKWTGWQIRCAVWVLLTTESPLLQMVFFTVVACAESSFTSGSKYNWRFCLTLWCCLKIVYGLKVAVFQS
jgi:hypothetical protein